MAMSVPKRHFVAEYSIFSFDPPLVRAFRPLHAGESPTSAARQKTKVPSANIAVIGRPTSRMLRPLRQKAL